jgi:hypothetical protein
MEINTGKTKIMAFSRKEPIRSKICFSNRILECDISYEGEKDLNMKIYRFIKVVGIINQIFKLLLLSRHTRIQIYKILAKATLS